MLRQIINLIAAFVFGTGAVLAQAKSEKSLPVNGQIDPDGQAIHLNLSDAKPPRVGNVAVKRRELGEVGGKTWQEIAPQLGAVMRFTDRATSPGVAYEYQVLRSARDIVDVGYFTAGVEIPAVETRGKALVIVDETIADDLALRLDRFEQDLIGDGWQVARHLTPRGPKKSYVESLKKAATLRAWIQEQYFADPFARHAVILVGHVPIALTGRAAPDGHSAVPHASDLFYAEMDGEWRLRRNDKGESLLGENTLPSNAIEMQIGRIDFEPVSSGERDTEIALLRAYFDKNHHWRQGFLGDLRGAYAQSGHLVVERDGLRNIVGPEVLIEGGHHDVGEDKPWLWGVDFGDHNGGRYASDYHNRAAFVINFGSSKQKIERFGNPLTASLAQPWYTVAAGWGGRPSWRLHHMALGRTIGESHMRTVNNGAAQEPYRESMDYFPTGNYLWRNPVWVNLLGDPTLRAFMLAPPSDFRAVRTGQNISLTWTVPHDKDTLGYKIYRADTQDAQFTALPDAELIDGTAFLDRNAPADARYMIRAYGLRQVHAGSFYTYSQGAFVQSDTSSVVASARHIDAVAGRPVTLPLTITDAESGVTEAIIHAPEGGDLKRIEGAWTYTPPEDASGQIMIPYARSTRLSTQTGTLIVQLPD